jgi:hypothetical protein
LRHAITITEQTGSVEKTTYESPVWFRVFTYQRGCCDDLIFMGHMRLLVDIDHLEGATACGLGIAQLPNLQNGMA